ncbi:putative bifunctional diguanylate cyclase/phosphodiesterase [Arenimonas composti]|uniref:EAL domain-containing protein n=1 Tax=Arenimonas composti TR7-09 = DSM 18010 TaxID=1121013 RepID=A0A091BA76_9GAMM|nr:bifunctional diguanylate cyclase/phosphodiesterase [Arenimonas composti]KFN48636.1 hypothetical protein P873_14145 [Arenimonas composti TR7-09 = DSM 18010]
MSSILRGRPLFERLQAGIDAAAAAGRPLGLLLLSIEGLGRFGILHGHLRAEALVELVRLRAQAVMRPDDTVLRLGPGEFLILLNSLSEPAMAALAATRLLREFELAQQLDGQPLRVQVAIGIATSPEHGRDADHLYRHAEAALALARGSADRLAISPARDFSLDVDPAALRDAIHGGALTVDLQPFLDLRTNRIAGAEALARWHDPGQGAVSPSLFVELAETSGLVADLTRWSVNATFKHIADARRLGIALPVSINLSAVAFVERGLVEHLSDALSLWDVDPGEVTIEVTETAIIADLERGAHILSRLGELGVGIAIDDFGVGNSSFAYLREFPATELKMDRSFVTGMLSSPRSTRLVEAMIHFAHHLDIRVVAEGVEDAATLEALRALDCDVVQGYLIGRPVPAAEFIASLAGVMP